MNYISVQGSDSDGSEDDGINVVLLGGALIPVAILLALSYRTFRRSKNKR